MSSGTQLKVKGPVIDVNLMRDKLVVEFPTYRTSPTAKGELPACGIYVITYDEIAGVRVEGGDVVLTLSDGSEVRLEVYAPDLLYRELVERLRTYRGSARE